MTSHKDEDMLFVVTISGVHTESHGYVSNLMFDEKRGRNIFMDDANFPQEKHEPHWWDDAEPLWVTAEKQVMACGWGSGVLKYTDWHFDAAFFILVDKHN